jgi:putative Mg2+ transporter-C (MgtC) family protein
MTSAASLDALPTVVAASAGQGLTQMGELALAFALSTLIGLEREWRQKSAGLRTHTLVGVGAALFMLVSKYGFGDVLIPGRTILDPSRVAAQVVSGIGFIGGGLIFVRGDIVRGLTTAAIVWVTAAVAMACEDGRGILRDVLGESTRRGFAIVRVGTQQLERAAVAGVPAVAVMLEVRGQPAIDSLATALDGLDGVTEVTTSDLAEAAD